MSRHFNNVGSGLKTLESLSPSPGTLKLVASLHGGTPSIETLSACARAQWVEIFVGPEGGLTEEEES
jgi:16S rRNA U1498 N3-methylase RsmE